MSEAARAIRAIHAAYRDTVPNAGKDFDWEAGKLALRRIEAEDAEREKKGVDEGLRALGTRLLCREEIAAALRELASYAGGGDDRVVMTRQLSKAADKLAPPAPKPEPQRTPQVGDWVRSKPFSGHSLRQVAFVSDMHLIFADYGVGLISDFGPGPPIGLRPGDPVEATLDDGRVVHGMLTDDMLVAVHAVGWSWHKVPRERMSLLALPPPGDKRRDPPSE